MVAAQQQTESVKGLAAKLAAIMGELSGIKKSGTNTHFNYKFITADDVMNAVRERLAFHGVMFFASMTDIQQDSLTKVTQKGERNYTHTRAMFQFTFADGDSGEVFTSSWCGEADDDADKGINKAATAATKYFLMRTFLIHPPSENDPDGSAGRNQRQQQQAQRPQPQQAQQQPAQKPAVQQPSNVQPLPSKPAKTEQPDKEEHAISEALVVGYDNRDTGKHGIKYELLDGRGQYVGTAWSRHAFRLGGMNVEGAEWLTEGDKFSFNPPVVVTFLKTKDGNWSVDSSVPVRRVEDDLSKIDF